MAKEIKLLGFNFTKILVERFPEPKGPVQLKSDINIKDITEPKNDLVKQDLLLVSFSFSLNFENLGQILMEGSFLLGADAEEAKSILEEWKSKNLNEEKKLFILNIIMQKCSLKALQLEEELNLPYHIQIPKLAIQNKPEEVKEDKKESNYIN